MPEVIARTERRTQVGKADLIAANAYFYTHTLLRARIVFVK